MVTPNSRLAMCIRGEQNSIRDFTQVALLFLQLCPEERRAVQVQVRARGIKPHISSLIVSSSVSEAGERLSVLHKARRGGDLVVLCCARRECHVGLGAGDYLIKIVTSVTCELKQGK